VVWKNLGPLAVTSRRRVVTSSIVYGLSLAVRFTSATGEEIEVPPQATQRNHPMLSIMINDGGQIPHKGLFARAIQPTAVHRGWPPAAPGLTPASSASNCLPPP
jgi:hypothetical protein